jgi:O-antigen/teichoic acid export membrane protein
MRHRVLVGNVAARVGALGSAFVATLLLAWSGGPELVGVYALLHVLPGLIGLILSAGLPAAIAFFLAGRDRADDRLPLTIVSMAVAGGAAGALAWIAAAPLLQDVLFPGVPLEVVVLAGTLVLSRLIVTTAKSCSQGSDDLPGANAVIFAEELVFLPAYGLVWAAGVRGPAAVVAGLLLADCLTSSLAWGRLVRRGFFHGARRPARAVARRIASYGVRAQVGVVVTQLNLRLDYLLLVAFTSPATLGVYAVASKYAELIRIPGAALGYVLYPKFARDGGAEGRASARRLVPRGGLLTAALALPLWLAAGALIPTVYGEAFDAAIVPAQIILLGLAVDGAAGVVVGFLYGVGRPGLTSVATTVGLAVTVALDLLLIPRFELVGAATASAVAYATTTLVLLIFFRRLARPETGDGLADVRVSHAGAG